MKMKNLKLKVCGMKDPENIREVAALQPDYLGFIFYEKSPRFFNDEIPEISSAVKKTGVFVDADFDYILKKVEKYQLKAVQLHGNEAPELCAGLQKERLEVIKVFSVKDDFDFEVLKSYEGKVDLFLFDTKGKEKGGNGITFNWEILERYPSKIPFFLSGGLGLEEMDKIEKYHFPESFCGIDVNSKFELKPGIKNSENLKKLKSNLLHQK